AVASDVAMAMLGGALKRKEQISARLGDVLSHLFMASAVLKYFQNHGQPQEDLPFVRWGVEQCLYQIQIAFDEVFHNLQPRWLARILKWITFPWGRKFLQPTDETRHQIAAMMMHTSEQRDRLTEFCYVGKNPHDVTGRMEAALQALENAR